MSVGRLISRLIIQSNVKARNRQFFLFYFLRKCLICMLLSFGKGIRNCKNKFLIKCLTLWLCSLYSTPKPKLIISINFVNRKKKVRSIAFSNWTRISVFRTFFGPSNTGPNMKLW